MKVVIQKAEFHGPEQDFLWWWNEHRMQSANDIISIHQGAGLIIVYYRCKVTDDWVCKHPGDY